MNRRIIDFEKTDALSEDASILTEEGGLYKRIQVGSFVNATISITTPKMLAAVKTETDKLEGQINQSLSSFRTEKTQVFNNLTQTSNALKSKQEEAIRTLNSNQQSSLNNIKTSQQQAINKLTTDNTNALNNINKAKDATIKEVKAKTDKQLADQNKNIQDSVNRMKSDVTSFVNTQKGSLQSEFQKLKDSVNQLLSKQSAFKVGMYAMFANTADFDAWLLCDGRSISTTKYKALFDVIGNNFGGDSSNFNLPNFVDRLPIMHGGSHSRGNTYGNDYVYIEVRHIPSYYLDVKDPSHTHLFYQYGAQTRDNNPWAKTWFHENRYGNNQVRYAYTGVNVHSGGSGQALDIRPSTLCFGCFFIYSGKLKS